MFETDAHIGRQPIFDAEGSSIAYELLHRNKGENYAVIHNDMQATARVIINLVHNIGVASIIGDKKGFINVDQHTLFSDHLLSLPKESFIFEILEYTEVTMELVERVRYLHGLGYRFALDDFSCANENIEYFKLLFPYTDIIKIDLLATDSMEIEVMVEKFKPYNVKLLAEKVESIDVFERCKEAGFHYFQGFFFERPTIISGKKTEPATINVINIINTFHTTSDVDVITRKFSNHPELTFNLLRYINSAAYHFPQEITSIKQIIVLLGPSRLRSWLGLFLYAGNENKMFKEAIFEAAKFRAKIMYDLVNACGRPELADEAFLTGSLSLIDAYLQIDMKTLLESIELSVSINDALLSRQGYLGKMLMIAEKLEKSQKIQTLSKNLAPKIRLTPAQLYTIYNDAHRYVLET